ncbi:inner centromere protein b [Lasius niger]|uniref:Inner centromere protein b n=1 Tax=Lasius niger TaxID=67767 RepID=A0A0J7JWZ0_LASNI|nr:inner centromere protein b [Lasius niger]
MRKDSQTKRKKSVTSSSDKEDTKSGSNNKYSKVDENLTETKRSTRKVCRIAVSAISVALPVCDVLLSVLAFALYSERK